MSVPYKTIELQFAHISIKQTRSLTIFLHHHLNNIRSTTCRQNMHDFYYNVYKKYYLPIVIRYK